MSSCTPGIDTIVTDPLPAAPIIGAVDTNLPTSFTPRWAESGPSDGDVIVLIAGTGASGSIWPDELIEGLVDAGLRVVRFDHRDTAGRRTPVGTSYDLWDMADDTATAVRAAGAAHARVLGWSLGGAIAQCLAVRHPDIVSALVLLGAPARPGAGLELGPEWATLPEDLEQLPVDQLGEHQPGDQEWVRLLAVSHPGVIDRHAWERHALAAWSTVPPSDAELAAVTVPTLILHGDQDRLVPLANAHANADGHPGAALQVVPGMGHLPTPARWTEIAALAVELTPAQHPERAKSRRASGV